MKHIFCDSPVILRNPKLGQLLAKHRVYVTPNHVMEIPIDTAAHYYYNFPKYQYSPTRLGVTLDNIDDFYVLSEDGEIFPMYITVPCGKCALCRDKKRREWSFRALCENRYSCSEPLFLTLTYNQQHLPARGVFKEELQLFMKRLRIHLDRLGLEHNLRYFACAEYGSKSGRPHYHMILWNFPCNNDHFKNLANKLHFVEQAWRLPTGEYLSDGTPVTEPIGFCYCVPASKGCIGYVMKYMRKEPKVPAGMLPPFFLSSRKGGGIGSAYAREYKDFYWSNPQCTDITVVDPYSGVSSTIALPAYFKNIYFPCNSKLVSKTCRDAVKRLCDIITRRISLHIACNFEGKPEIFWYERSVLAKFHFLGEYICRFGSPKAVDYYSTLPYTASQELYASMCLETASICRYLFLENYDVKYIQMRDEILAKRNAALRAKFDAAPELNINDVKYRLNSAIKLAESKEIL